MRPANMIHIMIRARTPTSQAIPRAGCLFDVTWMKAWTSRDRTKIHARRTNERSAWRVKSASGISAKNRTGISN